ncbi:MAG: hypothetical protein R2695_03205 [Acidimicrobiales bacterium]
MADVQHTPPHAEEAASAELFDDDGKLRMKRFIVATLASAVAIAVLVGVLMHVAAPDGGWATAMGVGAMIGFWMCPLGGAVFGNGLHEIDKDRRQRAAGITGH